MNRIMVYYNGATSIMVKFTAACKQYKKPIHDLFSLWKRTADEITQFIIHVMFGPDEVSAYT